LSWDPYAALGVNKSASADEIRKAYRKLAKELHPDVRPNDKAAEDKFKRATAAFNLLSEADQKARYDRGEIDADGNERAPSFSGFRPGGPGGPGGAGARGGAYTAGGESVFDLGDIFSDLFSGGGPSPRQSFGRMRGRDIRFSLDIDFLDAVKGGRRRVQLAEGRMLDVTIPPGVESGQTLRLKAQGGGGINGGPPGDALVELKVRDHPFFRREGDNIHMDMSISLAEAIDGARIQAPTPTGPVTLTIPPGANTGMVLRLKGKGVGGTGDQFVHLMVTLPDPIDEDLKKFVRKWPGRDKTPQRPG
jgi:DnaJ-class molecular chaperone